MSEFVRKTALGYRTVPGGHSDSECSHIILAKNEYNQILKEKTQAEQEKRTIEHESKIAIKRVQDDALKRVQKAQEEAQHSVKVLECGLSVKVAEIDYQQRLNANLLRISKERANVGRNLKPKKEHTGYVVVSSSEKEHRYKDSKKHWKSVTLWETVLQSPYSVDFTEEHARKQMLDELFQKDESGDCPIQKIGITENYSGGYAEMIGDKGWRENHHNYNVMLSRHLRANFRSGYWEIVFMHTKPLGVIPKDMRIR